MDDLLDAVEMSLGVKILRPEASSIEFSPLRCSEKAPMLENNSTATRSTGYPSIDAMQVEL